MPYCNEGWHTKQVSNKHQFQRTDYCHPLCKGSRAIRPLHFSDELCHLQARFECYYPPAGSAPTSSCCCTASTSYPSKTCQHGAQRCCNNIIGTTASIDVSHTCHASSTSLPVGQSQRHSYSSTQEPWPCTQPALQPTHIHDHNLVDKSAPPWQLCDAWPSQSQPELRSSLLGPCASPQYIFSSLGCLRV